MRIKVYQLPIFIIIILFGGILFTQYLNVWNTESNKVPRKIEEGEYAGSFDPADIRGSYTFSDIEKNYNVSKEILAEAFGIKDTNLSLFKVKDLKTIYSEESGIETKSVKLFVALYNKIPYEEYTTIPEPAYNILLNENKIDKGISEELRKYIVKIQ